MMTCKGDLSSRDAIQPSVCRRGLRSTDQDVRSCNKVESCQLRLPPPFQRCSDRQLMRDRRGCYLCGLSGHGAINCPLLKGSQCVDDDSDSNSVERSIACTSDIGYKGQNEYSPSLKSQKMIVELDHSSFIIHDRGGLMLLWEGLKEAIGKNRFPMNLFYREWKNPNGQFSFFKFALQCSDIIRFADYDESRVVLNALKYPTEGSTDIANWKSLNLMNTLVRFYDCGLGKLAEELIEFPIQKCPDVLACGLVQSSDTFIPACLTFLSCRTDMRRDISDDGDACPVTKEIMTIIVSVLLNWKGEFSAELQENILQLGDQCSTMCATDNQPYGERHRVFKNCDDFYYSTHIDILNCFKIYVRPLLFCKIFL